MVIQTRKKDVPISILLKAFKFIEKSHLPASDNVCQIEFESSTKSKVIPASQSIVNIPTGQLLGLNETTQPPDANKTVPSIVAIGTIQQPVVNQTTQIPAVANVTTQPTFHNSTQQEIAQFSFLVQSQGTNETAQMPEAVTISGVNETTHTTKTNVTSQEQQQLPGLNKTTGENVTEYLPSGHNSTIQLPEGNGTAILIQPPRKILPGGITNNYTVIVKRRNNLAQLQNAISAIINKQDIQKNLFYVSSVTNPVNLSVPKHLHHRHHKKQKVTIKLRAYNAATNVADVTSSTLSNPFLLSIITPHRLQEPEHKHRKHHKKRNYFTKKTKLIKHIAKKKKIRKVHRPRKVTKPQKSVLVIRKKRRRKFIKMDESSEPVIKRILHIMKPKIFNEPESLIKEIFAMPPYSSRNTLPGNNMRFSY